MQAFHDTVAVCEVAFHALEARVPNPERVEDGDDFAFRYMEHTPHVVAVQKLSRICTGLRAVLVLLERGLYQEVAVIFRMLDEFREDVTLMCSAIRSNCISELQQRFIDGFFQEEFDNDTPLAARQRRDRVPRRQIHAAIARLPEAQLNPSDAQEVTRTITSVNSGYVHGTSGHILEMYGGDPPRYHLNGMLGTRRQATFEELAWTYFYRSLLSHMEALLTFELNDLLQELFRFRALFERRWGRTEWPPAEELIREIRRNAT